MAAAVFACAVRVAINPYWGEHIESVSRDVRDKLIGCRHRNGAQCLTPFLVGPADLEVRAILSS